MVIPILASLNQYISKEVQETGGFIRIDRHIFRGEQGKASCYLLLSVPGRDPERYPSFPLSPPDGNQNIQEKSHYLLVLGGVAGGLFQKCYIFVDSHCRCLPFFLSNFLVPFRMMVLSPGAGHLAPEHGLNSARIPHRAEVDMHHDEHHRADKHKSME